MIQNGGLKSTNVEFKTNIDMKKELEITTEPAMRSFSLEELKEAFKAGQMQIWEDLEQTTRCAKFETFEEWFENYA